ncbi:hypothetical protein ACELLULO517_03875 [Acidisoma cellulosilytica]|uniref:DUF7380 domain-containing protein n=1 Tax=Acidisoma cellulosilyticum TaxID=2802395 RepID=A0A964E290_9PROT|nr:DUF4209 domain-containing protein [Acidisoma cellulosilyticum]MCB8879360.1 hypothetical protein [Acidisoma cellulosilyticum]
MAESHTPEAPQSEDEPSNPPWASAALEDLDNLDFEAPISGSDAGDSGDLADLYRTASQALESQDGLSEIAAKRVWDMLASVTGMYFKPADFNEPFGPMLVLDGKRSAIPSDFREHIDMLETMAQTTSNIILKARLCDVAWSLDHKRASLGLAAIAAYGELARLTEAGVLKLRYSSDKARFHYESYNYLQRALNIAQLLGWNKTEFDATKKMLIDIRKGAIEVRDPMAALQFSNLDLQVGVSDPLDLAADLETVLANLPGETNHNTVIQLWHLAAQAYMRAKRFQDNYRCREAAAETMVLQADAAASATVKSHFIANAIAALHRVPESKNRRIALRHQLIDVQAGISDEMSSFSHEIDLTELVEKVRSGLVSRSLTDSLFLFANLDSSPDPAKLETEAIETIRNYPLSSLFGATQVDGEGKVIHRAAGGAGFGDPDIDTITQQISQAESSRRYLVVAGEIEPARHQISTLHYVSDDVLSALLRCSPFVTPDLIQTFARGLTRFFQGDFTSAVYILTPLLENSLRHVLKTYGHDVTTFDHANQTQEDRTISSLFNNMRSELEEIFSCSIIEDIDRVFLTKPGPHLRHAVAHGLLYDGSPYGPDSIYACWLIFRLCMLPLFPYRQELGLD